MADWFEQLTREGYALLPGMFTLAEVEAAREACARALAQATAALSILADKGGPPYGARNLLRLWPEVIVLARMPSLAAALLRVLGSQGGVTRGLYFDKPPGYSWTLPWHRDRTVAVKKHGPLGQFRIPTRKAGVPHVEAPVALLAQMVTARIHLDRVTLRNGPLRVLPGSHLGEENASVEEGKAIPLTCEAGDVLLMRPLLLHGSVHSEPNHQDQRRIVHLECGPHPDLPDGYEWYDFLALQEPPRV
jgi:hypothetical protein